MSIHLSTEAGISPDLMCELCHQPQVDPRVLSCFHSFCLRCLHEKLTSEEAVRPFGSPRTRSSLRSGSLHNLRVDDESASPKKVLHFPHLKSKHEDMDNILSVACPKCRTVTKLPSNGVHGLLPNFVLQHRLVVASLNNKEVCLLCDLCPSEIPAKSRCSNCLINLCFFCADAHRQQADTFNHELLNLKEEGKGPAVLSVTRQLMCTLHVERQLTLFCTLCQQVICRDCCVLLHRGHTCEAVARAAQTISLMLREALERSRAVQRELNTAKTRLTSITQRVDHRCEEVEGEIDRFIEAYINVIHRHGQQLKARVAEARQSKLKVIGHHQGELQRCLDDVTVVSTFGEDLISEGSDTELLSFSTALLSKLESATNTNATAYLPRLKLLETLNFLPDEKAGSIDNKTVFGVVTTQKVSPPHCVLTDDALSILNNCRQQRKCEVVLLTRDSDSQPICHGGGVVHASARYRDLSRRTVPANVTDQQDGTYIISFLPDAPGNMLLTVTVDGTPIKGNPFPVCVRTLRPHQGTFHCCTFCSSAGRKDATCACGGVMPGGYLGCGHGHSGHPGQRHWSCCGNTLHNSECGKPLGSLFQFTM